VSQPLPYSAIPTIGQLAGQRVRTINLQVEKLPDGIRISTPQARGWSAHARNSVDLVRALEAAFREVSCASYARAKGAPYDLDILTTQVPGDPLADQPRHRRRTGRAVRHHAHDPAEWTKMEDGSWRSPGGRKYNPGSAAVRNVIRKRQEHGLPT
jgi:hypothetical protein